MEALDCTLNIRKESETCIWFIPDMFVLVGGSLIYTLAYE